MKNFVLFLVLLISISSAFASSTEASKFVESKYSKIVGNQNVSINVKKEHTVEYQQKIGDQIVPAITYGYGDMKAKKMKKTRISYIVLLDKDCKPFWSFVVPSK